MKHIYILLYNAVWRLAGLLLPLLALFHEKIRRFVEGRRGKWAKHWRDYSRPLAWFHVSSLGEFEQARPLMEALRAHYPHYQILLTFFSPSGYEVRKDYEGADHVAYLPYDTPKNSRLWYDTYRPSIVFWAKYDYWYHFITEASRRKLPLILFSALFRPGQIFFKPWGALHKAMLHAFTHIFVQDSRSKQLLKQHLGIEAQVAGDTRFDRVCAIARQRRRFPEIERFIDGQPCWVAGSAWKEDIQVMLPWLRCQAGKQKVIIAPHDTGETMLKEIEQLLPVPSIRYSQWKAQPQAAPQATVLLIDCIGMLASLYAYGKVAFVGGAFKQGLHNILESAVYGIPVLFGAPHYRKFREAQELIAAGGAFAVPDARAFEACMERLFGDEAAYRQAAQAAHAYVHRHQGATARILHCLKPLLA
ncbi:MAG: 3-deoxy-D-manno-octulosonic acid transferase [Thermonema sp.]|uniref:3-deoxy-D-manno-octulosonic acid transferase n=1 Tax=Thermonema sp. TaxID=2231181 RepID=UPI0021DE72DF|nr:glycosyltransferase N-terminal domain-containing protein [Thermonema sp.]GIV38324.1 MAG: 3-deoxy-D-manno-octulosonic acid transferase [Thermonema sp.]